MRTATWPDFSRVDPKDLPLQLTRLVLELRAELDDVRRNALAPLKTSQTVFNPSTPRGVTPQIGYVHDINSQTGDVDINLPLPVVNEAWGVIGLVRISTSNVVRIRPPSGLTVSGATSITMPTSRGVQFFWWTGSVYQWERG